jgi:hypothetical protein
VLVGLGLGGLAASLLAQRRSDDAVAAAQSGDSLSR